MQPPEEKLQQARQKLSELLENYRTASLATVSSEGQPHASYLPIAPQGREGFYLFVSELSSHTANLREQGRASLMLIEDEATSEQIFARNRVTFEGTVRAIPRDGPGWGSACQVYRDRFGKFFDLLVGLKDFQMFWLEPQSVRLVVGFGAAYRVGGQDWSELELLTGK